MLFQCKPNHALDHTEFCNVIQKTVHRTKTLLCCNYASSYVPWLHMFVVWFISPRSKYTSDCIASSDMILVFVNIDLEGNYPDTCLEGLRKTTSMSEDSRCSSWDSNWALPEIRVCIVTAKLFFSVWLITLNVFLYVYSTKQKQTIHAPVQYNTVTCTARQRLGKHIS
jgi:hypothetical protein